MCNIYIQGDQKVSVHLVITVYHQVHRDFLLTLYIFIIYLAGCTMFPHLPASI